MRTQLRTWASRLWSRVRMRQMDSDFTEELQSHLAMLAEDNVRRGMSPAEAQRQAALCLGGITQLRESHRNQRGLPFLEQLLQDLKFGLRLLRKDRGYTIAASIALALGIGANTAVFTIFTAVVLKPLPVPNPQSLVTVWRTTPRIPFGGLFSFADYVYFRDHNTAFLSLTAETAEHLHLSASSSSSVQVTTAEPVDGLFVTANYLATFGIHPIAGHEFVAEDDLRTAGPFPALLSENYFQRRFGSDPGVLGQTVTVSGMPLVIVGITPRDFMGTRPSVPDIWISSSALGNASRRMQDRAALSSRLTASLRPGLSLVQAQAELDVLANALRNQYPPQERAWNVRVVNATRFGSYRFVFMRLYLVLQVVMGLVLLIACTNVAGLLLGRAATRQREVAVRFSMGASRLRIVRQLLTEGILIAIGAGVFAYVFAQQTLTAISRSISADLASQGGTVALDLSPNPGTFAYVLGTSILAGISFALLPALQCTKVDLASALKNDIAALGARKKNRLRGGMIAAQICVALALLIGAGLLSLQSFRLLSVDPGFETRNVISFNILSPQELGYKPADAIELHDRIAETLHSVPGVVNVAFASGVPLGGNITLTRVVREETVSSNEQQQFPYTYVSRDYFKTLGIPLKRGRDFTSQEIMKNAPVAVISEALARRLWPGSDPIGKRIAVGSPLEAHFLGQRVPFSPSTEVIGVASDIYSQDLVLPDAGALYLPTPQGNWNAMAAVRVRGDTNAITENAVREIHTIEPNLAVTAETLTHMIATGEASAAFHVASIVFFAVGVLGFVLASIGVYSMVAYTVSQQTREVGIRMALGAQGKDLVRMILATSARWIAAGLMTGVLVGLALLRILASQIPQLFGGAHLLNLYVIVAVSAMTGMLALLAGYFPARHATRVDPATVLRFD